MPSGNIQPTPSQRLLLAVLRRAIWDFALYRALPQEHKNYKLAVDASGWLFWDGEEMIGEDGRFTFKYACEALDVDFNKVRECALKLNRSDIQRLSDPVRFL